MKGKQKDIHLPLYSFFKKLQAYDKKLNHSVLSFDVYLQLLETLDLGYGFVSKNNLLWLCKMIWLKPYHDEKRFEQLFHLHFLETNRETPAERAEEDNPSSKTEPSTPELEDPTKKPDDLDQGPDGQNDQPDTERDDGKSASDGLNEGVRKSISLSFQSETAAQSKFIETDLENIEKDIFSKIYRLKGKYTSISPRRVEQSLRSLRIERENYTKKYLDIPATIDRISNQGYMDELVYTYQANNVTEVNLLVDQGGSMVAFFDLVNLLTEKVQLVSPEKISVYYFRNCPVNKLYQNKEQTIGVEIDTLSKTQFIGSKGKAILILSDAGAARGRYDSERILATQRFLYKIRCMTVAWINPVPEGRWTNTSADYIAELVPMFEATDIAFINAMKSF